MDRLSHTLEAIRKAMPVTCPVCGWASSMKPGTFRVPACPACGCPANRMLLDRFRKPGAAVTYHEQPEGRTGG